MRKLRLLVTDACNRQCSGCCNKQWDLKGLPRVQTYQGYDEIMLTGGEPLLYPHRVLELIETIRKQTKTPVFVYTAKTDRPGHFLKVLWAADGVTLTLHEQRDVAPFVELDHLMGAFLPTKKSLRLNVFEGVDLAGVDLSRWQVKSGIRWILNCPLPEGEEFRRL